MLVLTPAQRGLAGKQVGRKPMRSDEHCRGADEMVNGDPYRGIRRELFLSISSTNVPQATPDSRAPDCPREVRSFGRRPASSLAIVLHRIGRRNAPPAEPL